MATSIIVIIIAIAGNETASIIVIINNDGNKTANIIVTNKEEKLQTLV